ncbi:MAG: glycosyltransferase [Phycisphaerae bacterium]|nr:glycosyltransferase [Phycisphaerae bacterium]
MKICIIANSKNIHTQRWAKAYHQHGNEVHVVSIRKHDLESIHSHLVHIGPVNSTSPFWSFLSYLWLLFNIKKILRKINPNIVDAHYISTHGVIGCFSKFHPLVINLWGSDIIWSGKGNLPFFKKLILKYALEKADCVASSSMYMMEYAKNISSNIKKILQIPFGIDCEKFYPKKECRNKNLVGYLKTMSLKYGPYVFLNSVPLIMKKVPTCRFMMVGRGDDLINLKKLAEKLNITDYVVFKDFVEHNKVCDILNSFEVYVNPSICKESFGVSILEASACEVPTVASNIGGITEVCINNKTGLLFEAGSSESLSKAVLQILGNNNIKEDLGKNGRKMVLEKYAWQDCVQKKLDLLKSLIKND